MDLTPLLIMILSSYDIKCLKYHIILCLTWLYFYVLFLYSCTMTRKQAQNMRLAHDFS